MRSAKSIHHHKRAAAKIRRAHLHVAVALALIAIFFSASWGFGSQTAAKAVETIASAVVYFVLFGEVGG